MTIIEIKNDNFSLNNLGNRLAKLENRSVNSHTKLLARNIIQEMLDYENLNLKFEIYIEDNNNSICIDWTMNDKNFSDYIKFLKKLKPTNENKFITYTYKIVLFKADVPTGNRRIYSRSAIDNIIKDAKSKEIFIINGISSNSDLNLEIAFRENRVKGRVKKLKLDKKTGNCIAYLEIYDKKLLDLLNNETISFFPRGIGQLAKEQDTENYLVSDYKLTSIGICIAEDNAIHNSYEERKNRFNFNDKKSLKEYINNHDE
jgi:hypothetical protein